MIMWYNLLCRGKQNNRAFRFYNAALSTIVYCGRNALYVLDIRPVLFASTAAVAHGGRFVMTTSKYCLICGAPAGWGNYCSRSCAGKATGGRPNEYGKPKIAKLGKHGYLYYTLPMLDAEERKLIEGEGHVILVHRLIMAIFQKARQLVT